MASIQYIADAFSGGAIDYDSALRKALTDKLIVKRAKKELPTLKQKRTTASHAAL